MSETLTELTEAMAKQAVADLRKPEEILAQALILTRVAEALGRDLAADPDGDDFESPRGGQHRRLLDEASVLTRIAKVANNIADSERQATMRAIDDGLDQLDQVDGSVRTDEYAPKPVNGVRFTAEVRGQFLGRVGGAEWMWGEQFGYLDVTHAVAVGAHADHRGEVSAVFSGVVKSTAGGMILGVTDQGSGVILPRYAVTESPDE